MEKFEYAIIGQGAAAFAAAIKADELGIKTIMIGKNVTKGTVIGGTCVNVGCVPSKRLIFASNFLDRINKKRFNGLTTYSKLENFKELIKDKDKLISKLRREKYKDVLSKLKNVKFIDGLASFESRNLIKVNNERIQADKILIATGARINVPKINGLENVKFLTNEEALSLNKLPKSMIIIGGRALGLEFAELFTHLGVKVTIVERSDRIIPNWEPEISYYLSNYLKEEGIKIIDGAQILRVDSGKNISVKIKHRNESIELKAEKLLLATGRKPNIEFLHLDKTNVKINKEGFIIIDKFMRTSDENIFAAGDVTGEPMLETLAAAEGNKATINAFTDRKETIDMNSVPSAIFTFPEAARVGLTDAEAREAGIRCACSTILLKDLPKSMIIKDERGLIKMVIDSKTKRILGVEILSENAADIINEATLAVKLNLTIDDIIDTIHVFPTLSEMIKLVAISFYKDIKKLTCCSQ